MLRYSPLRPQKTHAPATAERRIIAHLAASAWPSVLCTGPLSQPLQNLFDIIMD